MTDIEECACCPICQLEIETDERDGIEIEECSSCRDNRIKDD